MKNLKLTRKTVLRIIIVTAAVFCIVFPYFIGVSYTESYIGKDALNNLKKAVLNQILWSTPIYAVLTSIFFYSAFQFIKCIIEKIKSIKNNTEKDKNLPLRTRFLSGFASLFIDVYVIIFMALIVIFINEIGYYMQDFGAGYKQKGWLCDVKLLYNINKDIKENNVITENFDDIKLNILNVNHVHKNSRSTTHHYWITAVNCNKEMNFMITASDKNFLSKESLKYKDKSVKIEYYKNSNIIKNIEFTAPKHIQFLEPDDNKEFYHIDKKDTFFYYPLELTEECKENNIDIGWVVMRDGELVHIGGELQKNINTIEKAPFTANANINETCDLKDEISRTGKYKVYLAVIHHNINGTNYSRFKDPQKYWYNSRAVRISNIIEFEIKK